MNTAALILAAALVGQIDDEDGGGFSAISANFRIGPSTAGTGRPMNLRMRLARRLGIRQSPGAQINVYLVDNSVNYGRAVSLINRRPWLWWRRRQ